MFQYAVMQKTIVTTSFCYMKHVTLCTVFCQQYLDIVNCCSWRPVKLLISNTQMKIVGNNCEHFSTQLLTAWLTNWSPCFLQIFGYLLRLCRISWVLEEDFLHLKREAKDRPGLLHSSQYHCLQLYRHEMTHFVHALQNYVTSTVLEASWVEFLQNLKNANTLDDLYRMHVVYIKMVLFRWVSFLY